MTTTTQRPRGSLQAQVARLVVLVIALLALVQAGTSLKLYRDALEQELQFHSNAVARFIAGDGQLKVSLWAGYQRAVDERLAADVAHEPDVRYAAVVDGNTIAALRVNDASEVAHVRNDLGLHRVAADVLETRVAFEDSAAPGSDGAAKAAPATDDLGLLDAPAATAHVDEHHFVVVVGLDRGGERAAITRHLAISVGFGVIAVLLALFLVGRLFADIFRRMERMRGVAATLAGGDLRTAIADRNDDEIGAVARSFDEIRARWTTIIKDIRSVAESMARATRDIGGEAHRVADGSRAQRDAAVASSKRSAAIVVHADSLTGIVARMSSITSESQEALARAREASRSVTEEMERMLASLQQNDEHRADLKTSVNAIAAAVVVLDRNVAAAVDAADKGERTMAGAAETSLRVADHARTAVKQSSVALSLLDEQRASSDAVAKGAEATNVATRALHDTMNEVLNTTALIRDVADLTSMLSLNASIIAAQAGDRALGFGTIAEEVRSLATRTRAAVDGIERRAAGARRQLEEMGGVVNALTATVDTSRTTTAQTTTALSTVLEQMNEALDGVTGLAALIGESSAAARASRSSVQEIERATNLITDAVERVRGAQTQLDDSAAAMGKNAGAVRDTERAQAASTGALIDGMLRLAKLTDDLVALSKAQSASAADIERDIGEVTSIADRHRAHVDTIALAVSRLEEEAGALRAGIASLQVSDADS